MLEIVDDTATLPEASDTRARLAVQLLDVIDEAPPVLMSCLADINVLAVEIKIGALVPEK